ncbi:MAG: hypothetical protein IJB82_02340 [Bacilli bacterium]|nr:hypothetical protein [Bacilli bacterium]
MKLFLIIFSFFLFTSSLNAESKENLDFGSYSNYDFIQIENELPLASLDTLNKIYNLNERYYVTTKEEIGGVREYVKLNETSPTYTISEGYKLYFDNVKENTNYSFCNNNCHISLYMNYRVNPVNTRLDYNFENNSIFVNDNYNYLSFDSGLIYGGGFIFSSDNLVMDLSKFMYNNFPVISIYFKPYSNLADCYLPLYLMKPGEIIYSWEEIYPKTVVSFEYKDKDFYIFYTFEEISNFKIFSIYNFSSFNDFQRIVIVLGVNMFYLGFLGFIIYIFLKAFNKFITFLKQIF